MACMASSSSDLLSSLSIIQSLAVVRLALTRRSQSLTAGETLRVIQYMYGWTGLRSGKFHDSDPLSFHSVSHASLSAGRLVVRLKLITRAVKCVVGVSLATVFLIPTHGLPTGLK